MGPLAPQPIRRPQAPQRRRIRLGPQQGTPQISARVRASVEKRLQEDMKEQGPQGLLKGRWEEEGKTVLVAVAATRGRFRLRPRMGIMSRPLRSMGSPSAWTTWARWWFTRTAPCPGSATGAR